MSFEDIKKVNETIITTDVKGKQYAEVNQRIKAFRMLYPEGFIKTDIENLDNGICVMRAEIGYYTEDKKMMEEKDGIRYVEEYKRPVTLGTGTAYEKENSTFINKTSYIENCETSAVGRALAMCGIGIDTSIASKEEVENAIEQQEQQKKDQQIRSNLIIKIKSLMYKKNVLPEEMNAKYEKSSNDMNNEELEEVVGWLEQKEDFDYEKQKQNQLGEK